MQRPQHRRRQPQQGILFENIDVEDNNATDTSTWEIGLIMILCALLLCAMPFIDGCNPDVVSFCPNYRSFQGQITWIGQSAADRRWGSNFTLTTPAAKLLRETNRTVDSTSTLSNATHFADIRVDVPLAHWSQETLPQLRKESGRVSNVVRVIAAAADKPRDHFTDREYCVVEVAHEEARAMMVGDNVTWYKMASGNMRCDTQRAVHNRWIETAQIVCCALLIIEGMLLVLLVEAAVREKCRLHGTKWLQASAHPLQPQQQQRL